MPTKKPSAAGDAGIEEVRRLAMAEAGATEVETWGRPTFRAGDSIFATVHGDLLILRATPEQQRELLAGDTRFSKAPYWGKNGWVAVTLGSLSTDELAARLAGARSLIGPHQGASGRSAVSPAARSPDGRPGTS